MNIQPIGNNKFIVSLSREDMQALDITYSQMDYADIETRRVIWTILDDVRKSTGRDIDPSGNLVIETVPDNSGGCILIFTVPSRSTHIGTVISRNNPTQLVEFESLDNMLDALIATGISRQSARFFTDGKKYRAELPSDKVSVHSRIIEEFGRLIGADRMTAAITHEHWRELSS